MNSIEIWSGEDDLINDMNEHSYEVESARLELDNSPQLQFDTLIANLKTETSNFKHLIISLAFTIIAFGMFCNQNQKNFNTKRFSLQLLISRPGPQLAFKLVSSLSEKKSPDNHHSFYANHVTGLHRLFSLVRPEGDGVPGGRQYH